MIGVDEAVRLAEAHHMPSHASLVLARILWTAVDRLGMDRFAYLELDKERATLIDHIGGCERILTTPMPRRSSTQVRRFLFLFLILLPFGLIPKFTAETVKAARQVDKALISPAQPHAHEPTNPRVWLVVPITMVVAFPLLALDKIGSDLQKPFWRRSINDLKLDTYTTNIERTLLALLDGPRPGSRSPSTSSRSTHPPATARWRRVGIAHRLRRRPTAGGRCPPYEWRDTP